MSRGAISRRKLVRMAGAGGVALAILPGGATAQENEPGMLVVGAGAAAERLDPALTTTAAGFDLLHVAYERLVTIDDAGQPQPLLAESWDIPDDLTYVLTLRPGVTFHNGQPLTADDVKWTIDRIKDPATESRWASQFAPIDSIDSDGNLDVTLHLASPYGPLLSTLAAPWASIVPRDQEIDFNSTMVGTGPFQLDSVEDGGQVTFLQYPAYWQADVPLLEQITWRIVPEEADRLAAIQGGELELTMLTDPLSVASANESDGVIVLEQETTDYFLLGFNCARAPFDDKKVRQALSRAIDRQAIIDTVLEGHGQVTGPIVPTMGDWAQPAHQLPHYRVDHEGARERLEEAGKTGLSFTILLSGTHPEYVGIGAAIQEQLQAIDVSAGIEEVDQATFDERWQQRDFDAFITVNRSGNDPDPALYPAFASDGSVNASQFSDEEVDKLLNDGRNTADRETRKAIYQNLEIALADAAPAIFISTRVAWFATRDTIQGFRPSAVQSWDTLKNTTDQSTSG